MPIRLFPGAVLHQENAVQHQENAVLHQENAVLHPGKHCTGTVKVIYNPVVWMVDGWKLASWTDVTANTVNDFQLPHSFDQAKGM